MGITGSQQSNVCNIFKNNYCLLHTPLECLCVDVFTHSDIIVWWVIASTFQVNIFFTCGYNNRLTYRNCVNISSDIVNKGNNNSKIWY